MNLVVDIGNTEIKTATFLNGKIVSRSKVNELELSKELLKVWGGIIISTVKTVPDIKGALILTNQTPLPISIDYKTPTTLGVDRIAAAVGAFALFPNSNTLIIDLGTCATYEFINSKNIYEGGIISPGWKMRLEAMHHFTAKLPKIESQEVVSLIGKSTNECMQSGAFLGLSNEINGIIEQYKAEKNDLRVLMCGGDAKTFESKVKARIFAEPNLVLIGLNRILEYNNAK